jgi:hypothetical protein
MAPHVTTCHHLSPLFTTVPTVSPRQQQRPIVKRCNCEANNSNLARTNNNKTNKPTIARNEQNNGIADFKHFGIMSAIYQLCNSTSRLGRVKMSTILAGMPAVSRKVLQNKQISTDTQTACFGD